MRRYGELILSLKKYYAKQNRNDPRTLTNMYGLMVAFEPTREKTVAGGRNKGLNFRNVAADSKNTGDGDHGGGGDMGRNIEC